MAYTYFPTATQPSSINDVDTLNVLADVAVHVAYEGLQELPLRIGSFRLDLGNYDAPLAESQLIQPGYLMWTHLPSL